VAQETADRIEEMSEMYSTSGQYDLLGKFYLDPEQDIGLFVTERLQTLPGVKDTYTLITFNAFSPGG
ncbi:MAG: Lrp/AsnC family transcriptional regulator, partial [Alphaproteobacteria bacterium]|nr:Lrp/AsnC family transcriptional regulator [Alphaproteobacteria bacterium]